jgi:hypothetical protein
MVAFGQTVESLSGIYEGMRKLGMVAPPEWITQIAFGSNLLTSGKNLWDEAFSDTQTGYTRQIKEALTPTQELNRALQEQATSTAAAERGWDSLTKMIDKYYNSILAPLDAEERWEAAIDGVTESIKNNGKTLDVHTEKGRANRDALEEMVTAARNRLEQGGITEQQYLAEIEYVETLGKKFHDTTGFVDGLVQKFKTLPSKLTTDYFVSIVLAKIPQLPGWLTSGKGGLVILPPVSMGEHSGEHGAPPPPSSALPGHSGQIPGLAAGGPAFAGRPVIVGDGGRPEVFVPNTNGTVYPSVSAFAGGGTVSHVIDLRLNGRTVRTISIDDALARGVPESVIELAYP